jgi:hypothetical protein
MRYRQANRRKKAQWARGGHSLQLTVPTSTG